MCSSFHYFRHQTVWTSFVGRSKRQGLSLYRQSDTACESFDLPPNQKASAEARYRNAANLASWLSPSEC